MVVCLINPTRHRFTVAGIHFTCHIIGLKCACWPSYSYNICSLRVFRRCPTLFRASEYVGFSTASVYYAVSIDLCFIMIAIRSDMWHYRMNLWSNKYTEIKLHVARATIPYVRQVSVEQSFRHKSTFGSLLHWMKNTNQETLLRPINVRCFCCCFFFGMLSTYFIQYY